MASLSSHPLPPSALNAPALRRLYERTPPSPEVAPDLESGPRIAPSHTPESAEEFLRHESGARPRTLGERYEICGYLDSGGTADVFTAVDRFSGGLVAVKILKPAAMADARLRHYFLQGARGALRIDHPNSVRLIEVVDPPGSPSFAVMEIVQGAPLSSLLSEHRFLPPQTCVELALQAAAGLEAAHRAGVVHCDVKPENLLVELPPLGAPRLKVIDFDLATVDGEEDVHEHPMLRGTAKYMAPEQVVGDRVDARTDVYSLGVVLFRMLTVHLPFDLELCPTLLWHQFASPAPPPSWLCDGLDARLEAIVLRALRKSPDNRYPSMHQFVLDLRALEFGGELLATGPYAEPDAYLPQTTAAREAARLIARCV